jgi:beta-glucanase (GH16 family)
VTKYVSWGNLRTLVNNEELEYYVDRDVFDHAFENPVIPFSVKDGQILITASRTPDRLTDLVPLPFISGLVSTDTKFSQHYGYFEVRFRPPAGRGLWPAVWMVAATHEKHIEIDLYEMLGHQPDEYYVSLHAPGREFDLHKKLRREGNAAFHTVGVLWEQDSVTWFMDGKSVATARFVSEHPMYLIVNLAVGGSWPGAPDSSTQFPASLAVDYMRVYQRLDRLSEPGK